MTVRVVIIDDHRVFADSLSQALGNVEDIEVVGVGYNAADAVRLAGDLGPDVVLLDVILPDGDGPEVVGKIRDASDETKVVTLTGSVDVTTFARVMNRGVSGYLTKTAPLGEVAAAIRTAAAGGTVVPTDVIEQLSSERVTDGEIALSPRERDVLMLLAEGCDQRTVAATLDISWHTARSYVKTLLAKLGAHSQLEAVAIARHRGLLERSDS